MDLQEIPRAQIPRSALQRIFVGHNPFFLFSALCMLFQITDALTPTTLRAWGPISVIAVLVLLGIGVLSSLYKGADRPPDA